MGHDSWHTLEGADRYAGLFWLLWRASAFEDSILCLDIFLLHFNSCILKIIHIIAIQKPVHYFLIDFFNLFVNICLEPLQILIYFSS